MSCLCPMWLARVITVVLVLRHSNENHSIGTSRCRHRWNTDDETGSSAQDFVYRLLTYPLRSLSHQPAWFSEKLTGQTGLGFSTTGCYRAVIRNSRKRARFKIIANIDNFVGKEIYKWFRQIVSAKKARKSITPCTAVQQRNLILDKFAAQIYLALIDYKTIGSWHESHMRRIVSPSL